LRRCQRKRGNLIPPPSRTPNTHVDNIEASETVATPNSIFVSAGNSIVTITDSQAPITPGAGCTAVTYATVTCSPAGVTSISVSSRDQGDVVTVAGAVAATIDGGRATTASRAEMLPTRSSAAPATTP
jgi:hypothetical protein